MGASPPEAVVKPIRTHLFFPAAILLLPLLLTAGCSDRDPAGLEIARATDDPVVFADEIMETDVYYQPFAGTKTFAVSVDTVYAHSGDGSMMITLPPEDSPLGAYAGGVLTSVAPRDLTAYNALTFYARADAPISLNVAGFGNDNTGTSRYEASTSNITVTTSWRRVVIPIPNAARLIAERGLFTFAEALESGRPEDNRIWFDQIEFATVDNIADPRPWMPSATKEYFAGATVGLAGTNTTYRVLGLDVEVAHGPGYFDFEISDPSVAVVENDVIRIIGEGEATVTASLLGVPAEGSAVLSGKLPPADPAPAPTEPIGEVVSLFSDVYQNSPVDSFIPNWQYSTAELSDFQIDGDNALMYSSLNFVGIDFRSNTVDASQMDYLHLDVYAAEGTGFNVKIVAFNDDNGFIVGQSELAFGADTTPAFTSGEWSSMDIPLADFGIAQPLDHVGQLVLSTGDAPLVLIDNIYFHR